MLRLPPFRLLRPRTAVDAVQMRNDSGDDSAFVAGGTDLYPNMKRRQQTPATVISLRDVIELCGIRVRSDDGVDVGAAVTLSELAGHPYVRSHYAAVADAAALVSTPLLRNMGTIGGNLLLDTRCNYYDQGYEWRRSINFCMKKDGDICWVAPSSQRCWAVQSSDGVPVAVALGADVSLLGPNGLRRIPAAALYHNDGIKYTTKHPGELLTAYHLPPPGRWRANYTKLRRRGSFDFPVLGVATFIATGADGAVEEARVVLGAVASYPAFVADAASVLVGSRLSSETIAAAADAAFRLAKPMDNTDFTLAWRKEMVRVHVQRSLEQLA